MATQDNCLITKEDPSWEKDKIAVEEEAFSSKGQMKKKENCNKIVRKSGSLWI